MPPRFRLITALLLTAALATPLALAAPASASHGQTVYFEAGSDLFKPSTQAKTFAKLKLLGVKALRIELSWASVAPDPGSATKPHFEAANPASYDWSEYASALAEAHALKWPVLLTVTSPVPRWATSNKQAPYVTRPDAADFKQFMTAVGEVFGGEVSLFAIWNEPNHPAYLLPQWNANGTPASPRIYRGLWEYGYEGLQAAGIKNPKVLFGETAPEGYDSINVRREGSGALHHDVAPLMFLREALCLNSHYRRSGTCSELPITGYAHHAYNKAVSPYWVNPMKDDVNIGTLSRLSSALDKAAAAHAIPSHTPIYLTEFGVQTYPNHELGLPVSEAAEYDAIDEEIAYNNPSVAAFSQYLLQDDPLGGKPGASANGGFIGFQTGLEYVNGSPKPLYYGWPVPLTVTRTHSGYSLWGLVRPAQESTKLTVLVRVPGSSHYRTLTTVTTNSRGYWTLHSTTRATYWRVKWKSPTGRVYEGPAIKAFTP
jgi:hypothetical protein